MSVLVVGTVAFDSIETPSGSAERILGGSASYFSLAASFFTPVRIVGVIGQDFPKEYLELFSQRQIDLEGVRREKGDTFHWRGRYHEDINVRDTLELHLNVLAGFVPQLPERYRDAEYVFLGNIDPVMQLEVLNQIRRMKLVVCDTMDHWIQGSPEELRKVLKRIEMLVINDSEARLLSGYSNIVRAARAILKNGAQGGTDQARRIRRVAVFGFIHFCDAGLPPGRSIRSHGRGGLFCRWIHGPAGTFGGSQPERHTARHCLRLCRRVIYRRRLWCEATDQRITPGHRRALQEF